ncbi:MAG TPA: hypothetical protein VN372_07185 [Methanospirillum sp.]|nr:hypothetical protein [Methanospirillum sp.]
MIVTIDGFWTTKAGDYDPQKSVITLVSDNRFFYRINHDSKQRQKVITEILVDGKQLSLVHEWLSSDGRETNFFDIPLSMRTPGKHTLMFKIYAPVSEAADAVRGEKIYETEAFSLEFTQ